MKKERVSAPFRVNFPCLLLCAAGLASMSAVQPARRTCACCTPVAHGCFGTSHRRRNETQPRCTSFPCISHRGCSIVPALPGRFFRRWSARPPQSWCCHAHSAPMASHSFVHSFHCFLGIYPRPSLIAFQANQGSSHITCIPHCVHQVCQPKHIIIIYPYGPARVYP